MYNQQRAEHDAELLLGLGHAHRFSEPLARNIEEFCNPPEAYDFPQELPSQLSR